MSYRCRVWRIWKGGEEELPACPTEHKTVDAAMNCRYLKKGTEPLHRWEIRGGAFVVEKGEGARGWSVTGKVQGGIAWEYSHDFLKGTEKMLVMVGNRPMINRERKAHCDRNNKWDPDFVRGLAYGIGMFGAFPERTWPWVEIISEANKAEKNEEEEEFPENVVKGPWK